MANRVVLPAPLGPIRAVMRPASAASETLSTASRPPNLRLTPSRRTTGSAMSRLRLWPLRGGLGPPRQAAKTAQQPRDAVGREGDDQDEDGAVDDQIEAGRIVGEKLRR